MVESGGVFSAEKRDEDEWTKYRHVIAQSILQSYLFVKFMHLEVDSVRMYGCKII